MTGKGIRIRPQFVGRANCHDLTAMHPGTRPEVNHHIRIFDSLLVVFNNQDGIAAFSQIAQGINQAGIITWMQSYGRFVQDVTYPT